MPGLVVDTETLVERDQPYPSSCDSNVSKLRSFSSEQNLVIAEALEILQKNTDDLNAALRQNSPTVQDVTVVDQSGDLVAKLGEIPNEDGTVSYGAWFRSIWIGDAVGDRNPADAPFYADEHGRVFIGHPGFLTVLDPYGNSAAWLGAKFDFISVTGAMNNGSGLIRLTVPSHTLQTGDVVNVDEVGGVDNARGRFAVTVVDANHIDLQQSVFDGAYISGGTVDRLMHVTGAVNNGSGLIRLTVTGHGYESGDVLNVEGVGGVPNATGQWIIDVVDTDHFDLQSSTFAGAYTSNGTALRYAAGGLFQTIAIGPSFVDYRLRAFADGTLKIRNAEIILTDGDNTIILDPTLPAIIVRDEITLWQTRLQDGQIYVEDLNNLRAVQISPELIFMLNAAGGAVVSINSTGEDGSLQLRDALGNLTVELRGDIGSIDITGSIHADGSIGTDNNLVGHRVYIDTTQVIDESRDAVFNSLNLTNPLQLSEGGTSGASAADARTNLSVYSKAEVDALIATRAEVTHGHTAFSNGSHTHGGAVSADGSHTHSVS